jgi:hypothetical protein
MAKNMYESRTHATMMKRMIRSTETVRVIDAAVAKRGETVDMKPSATPTSFQEATLIEAVTGMMIGAATDTLIIGIATAAGMKEVEATTGIDHHGCKKTPFAEQLNAPGYIHAYIDPKDNTKKSSHLLRDC